MTRRILVLGGTGRTGRHVIEHALAAGHSVNVLARTPQRVERKDAKLRVFEGTPENEADIDPAIEGCDAVIATMNNARASDSPFAKLVNPPSLLTECYGNIIASMKRHGVQRIVHLGAYGAGDSFSAVPWLFKVLIKRTNLGVAYRDHEGVEAALAESGLDWTVGRAVGLGKKTSAVVESYVVNGRNTLKPSMQVGRESVGKWLVEALDRSDLHGKTPTISAG